MEKLKSRKFWLAIVGAIIPVLNATFDFGLDDMALIAIASSIVSGIFGLAVVDKTSTSISDTTAL